MSNDSEGIDERSLSVSYIYYNISSILLVSSVLAVWVVLRPLPIPTWVPWFLAIGPILLSILTAIRGVQKISLQSGQLTSHSRGRCKWQISIEDVVRGSGKFVNLNQIEFRTRDGSALRFASSYNYSETLDVINHFLDDTEDSIDSDDETIRLRERRLRFALGEDSFELKEGVTYSINQAYSPRRDLELRWFMLIPVSVLSLFITSISITAIRQSPIAIALCIGWFGLLAALVGIMAIKTFSRFESIRDQYVVRDGQLIITRDYLPLANIPVPEWDPPQSPVKAVQELDVLGKRYLLDRSVLISEVKV